MGSITLRKSPLFLSMPFIDTIAHLKSLSIVGLAKNTGKTETLNYILSRLSSYPNLRIGLTSIGIDGEKRDQVTQTDKPEIVLQNGALFVTAEMFYRSKLIPAEVCYVDSKIVTPIGKTIYAKAKGRGKILIAGPSTTYGLQVVVQRLHAFHANLVIIDGALSRMSLASPSIAEGIVLATGAAFSAQPTKLVAETKAVVRLINLDKYPNEQITKQLMELDDSLCLLDACGNIHQLQSRSALLEDTWERLAKETNCTTLFIPGVITDSVLKRLQSKNIDTLLVKDFTHVYASALAVTQFLATGRKIEVLLATNLVAVTFNPQSPQGYKMDSERMCYMLSEAIQMPVYDVRRINRA